MIAIPIRLRWLLAILVAFSLILPHLVPPGAALPSGESTRVAVDSAAFGKTMELASGAEAVSGFTLELGEAHGGESFGDAYSGDYSHETDKLLLLFSLHLRRGIASWSSVYSVVQSPDPVFSFERPPKSTVA